MNLMRFFTLLTSALSPMGNNSSFEVDPDTLEDIDDAFPLSRGRDSSRATAIEASGEILGEELSAAAVNACTLEPDAVRTGCGRSSNLTQAECQSSGCCWEPQGDLEPACYQRHGLPSVVEDAAYWQQIGITALNQALLTQPIVRTAKNIILFIGDGMSLSTVNAARILKGQMAGHTGEESHLSFEDFPHTALLKTYCVDRQVPESACTATALLCGIKSNANTIGVSHSVQFEDCGTMSPQTQADSILKLAAQAGKTTGLISTARVTHATPAPLYGHSPSRAWEHHVPAPARDLGCQDLATQLLQHSEHIQVILGGGRSNFFPSSVKDPEYPETHVGKRQDGRNLVHEWLARTWGKKSDYVWTKKDFENINPEDTNYLLGLFEPGHMGWAPSHLERNDPSLAEMVEKSLKILQKNKHGFFLFVEGGLIDKGHHEGRASRALHEALALDKAVQRAHELTDPANTLIVVTADHGHTLTIGGHPSRGNPILGLVDTEVSDVDYLPFTTLAYANGPGHSTRRDIVDTAADDYRVKSAVPRTRETHSGEDVPVFASGPMAHLLRGVQEQTYVAHVIRYAACLGSYRESHCTREGRTPS
ncbi:alkaline phosphatase-like [Petromyzon marinus]|uniref:alkaline phosphatase n=1 Tax=Petromyzon marinus TaxID=7757 RepID=A0AAJ7TMT6_PETMA|nr:alkaline phosphatase-like [Petromyzon marinus]